MEERKESEGEMIEREERDTRRVNLLIGITGSVAAIKDYELVSNLYSMERFNIKIIYTGSATHFLKSKGRVQTIKKAVDEGKIQIPRNSNYDISIDFPGVESYFDEDEWKWDKRGDEVLHIELQKWADVLLIAPLSSNSLAKIANGICDNLLVHPRC